MVYHAGMCSFALGILFRRFHSLRVFLGWPFAVLSSSSDGYLSSWSVVDVLLRHYVRDISVFDMLVVFH
jgi:hypothetical protein